MNDIKIDLVPLGIKNLMKIIQKISAIATVFLISILTFMYIIEFFADVPAAIMVSLFFVILISWLLYLAIRFNKVNLSTVQFTDEHICIFTNSGKCRRKIEYNVITDVRVEEVAGFYYGEKADTFKYNYICIFLNGTSNIPDVSYVKKFSQKDFIMFSYNEEALQWVQMKLKGMVEDK